MGEVVVADADRVGVAEGDGVHLRRRPRPHARRSTRAGRRPPRARAPPSGRAGRPPGRPGGSCRPACARGRPGGAPSRAGGPASPAAGGSRRPAGPGAGSPQRRTAARHDRFASRVVTFCSQIVGNAASVMAPVRPMRSPGSRRWSSATSGCGEGSKPSSDVEQAAQPGDALEHLRRAGPPGLGLDQTGPPRGGAGWPARPVSRWPATSRRRPGACCGPPPDRDRAGRGRRRCGFLGRFPDDTHAQVPETGSNDPDQRAADVVEPRLVVPPALGRPAGRCAGGGGRSRPRGGGAAAACPSSTSGPSR